MEFRFDDDMKLRLKPWVEQRAQHRQWDILKSRPRPHVELFLTPFRPVGFMRSFRDVADHEPGACQRHYGNTRNLNAASRVPKAAQGLRPILVYVPFLNPVFKTQPLTPVELAIVLILSAVVFIAVEIEKMIKRRNSKKHT